MRAKPGCRRSTSKCRRTTLGFRGATPECGRATSGRRRATPGCRRTTSRCKKTPGCRRVTPDICQSTEVTVIDREMYIIMSAISELKRATRGAGVTLFLVPEYALTPCATIPLCPFVLPSHYYIIMLDQFPHM